MEQPTNHQKMLKALRKGERITLHYTLIEWFIPRLYKGETIHVESGAGTSGTHIPTVYLTETE